MLLKYGRLVEMTVLDMLADAVAELLVDLEFFRFLLEMPLLLLLADRDLLEVRWGLAAELLDDFDSGPVAEAVCFWDLVEVVGLDAVIVVEVDADSEESEEDGEDGEM